MLAGIAFSTKVQAQSKVTLHLTSGAIAVGGPAECSFTSATTSDVVATTTSNTTGMDSIHVTIWADDTHSPTAPSPATLRILVEAVEVSTIQQGDSSADVALPGGSLTGSVVTLMRHDSNQPLCRATPIPRPVQTLVIEGNRTSFIADGAVGAGLRSGSGNTSLTGSLGILHESPKSAGTTRTMFCSSAKSSGVGGLAQKAILWTLQAALQAMRLGRSPCINPIAGERLKAIVTLASSVDTLRAVSTDLFVQAVLAPEFAGGQAGSGTIDYYVYGARGGNDAGSRTGTEGLRTIFYVSRSNWQRRVPTPEDMEAGLDTTSHAVSIVGLDARWRWAFIDHRDDPARGNNFAFAVEFGPALRLLADGSGGGRTFRHSVLGTTHRFFYGGSLAFSVALRQVTAEVSLPVLAHLTHEFQPVIGIHFDAPFFTF